nr:2-C-methyl-D-erythritol 4-phosphate cytidylyltransferase [Actinomycetota bacterium]
AYRSAAGDGFEGTDTSSCVQTYTDLDVRVFPGSPTNLKVTFAPDVALAERLLQQLNRDGSR